MALPRDRLPESTLAFRADPYRFISRRCARFGTDAFETRLLLERTICITGPEAAELFYDAARFRREGATPDRLKLTLFGRGGIQGMDGTRHRDRKAMFLSLMQAGRLDALDAAFRDRLRAGAGAWGQRGRIELQEEMQVLLTAAVCDWAGVPLDPDEVADRTRMLSRLFLQAGSAGPVFWRTVATRRRAERWAEGLIGRVRAGTLDPPPESALHVIATWQDPAGARLAPGEAAVALLNVLRPTVAVSAYITFAAHALHLHPAQRAGLTDREAVLRFVQEVRRLSPFFPAVMARVREAFEWRGAAFPAGRRVLLDIFATNRDARIWEAPDTFRPDRFRDREPGPFELIAQGGGDHATGHRCPGEWIAIRLTALAVEFLLHGIAYDVPDQDLSFAWSSLPALPGDCMILGNVAAIGPASRG